MITRAAADAALDLLLAPRCAGCGAAGSWLCLDCRDLCEPVRHGRVTAAGTYGGALREAIHRFKYGGERALANELGALVADRVAADLATGTALDVVVPAVLHSERARSRGYDQAWLLAAVVAERTALPLRVPLRRIRLAVPQITLDRAARAENLRGAYVAEAGALRGARVALVDDVATTGATLAAATGALRAAGARAVHSYVVALDA
ncbi:MAG: phosphoribosyltransferase family protein [Chloroflexota bacterium]